MKIPRFSAAWMTVVPSGTLTSRLSMLSLGMLQPPSSGLAPVADVRFKLVPEFGDVGLDGPGSCIREDADGLSFHVARDAKKVIQVLKSSQPPESSAHNAMTPPGPLAAG